MLGASRPPHLCAGGKERAIEPRAPTKAEETQPFPLFPQARLSPRNPNPKPQAAWDRAKEAQSRRGAELCLEQVPGLEMAPDGSGGSGQRTLKAA